MRNYSKREAKEYNWLRAFLHYVSIHCILRPYFKIFYKSRIEGRENIPKNESFIVAANHLSLLDPVIISTSVKRPIAFMAKKQLFEKSPLREVIDIFGAFAVNREKLEISTIRTAQSVMSTNKWVLAMFPQGSREIPGQITMINSGAAYLAKLTKTKILPVAIVGSEIYNPLPFQGNLVVKIGKPIEVSENLDETMKEWRSIICEMTGFKSSDVSDKEIFSQKN